MDKAYTSPLLNHPGAVAASGSDTGVAAHYGDPFREQREYAAGERFVDLSHREIVRVTGADRLSWMHLLTTQHLENLAPHEPTTALILDANGRVEHALYGVDDGEATWWHVEPGTAKDLVAYLDSMRFWSHVEVEEVTDQFALVAEGIAAETAEHAARVTAHSQEVFVPRSRLTEYVRGKSPAGIWAHEALRIAAHEPRLGLDTDHRTIPHELGWIGTAVHMDKGCYRGQETVARVHTLGRPPRRLVMLHLDGSMERLPESKAEVVVDDRVAGYVGSSARHYELGPIALAVVKRNVPVDVELSADGIPASQEVIVDPGVGLHVRPGVRK